MYLSVAVSVGFSVRFVTLIIKFEPRCSTIYLFNILFLVDVVILYVVGENYLGGLHGVRCLQLSLHLLDVGCS